MAERKKMWLLFRPYDSNPEARVYENEERAREDLALAEQAGRRLEIGFELVEVQLYG